MTAWDHGFVAVLLTAIPVWGRVEYRRLVRRVEAGGEATRVDAYRSTVLIQWLLVAAMLGIWFGLGRGAAELGLSLRMNAEAAIGAGVTAAGLAVFALQRLAVRRLGPEGRARLRAQFASTRELLPRNARERGWFRAVAVTAGICEELLYRGFLIAYAASWAGEAAGALLAAAAFGVGHLYQGPKGAAKTFLVGAAAGWLYLASESLLWPAILHVALDLQGGALGAEMLRDDETPGAA